jgi:hypothetical protein
MATQRNDARSVTRTYRAAVKLGDDYITLEETVTLPIDASDEEVTQAVDLGLRIYRAQREAIDAQVTTMREAQGAPAPIVVRDPDAPASDKQRNYIAALQDDLQWSAEHLGGYAHEQNVDLVTMTKGQASVFIDGLKKLADERGRYPALVAVPEPPANAARDAAPASEQQLRALQKLANDKGLNLDDEAQRRYSAAPNALTSDQAAALLREWQRVARTINGRRPQESAL